MRHALIIATALISISGLSACGQHKGQSKLAAAKATGNQPAIAKTATKVMNEVHALNLKLENEHAYFGMKHFGKSGFFAGLAASARERTTYRTSAQYQKILNILREIHASTSEVAKGGKGVTPALQEDATVLAERSGRRIETVRAWLKTAQDAEAQANADADAPKTPQGHEPLPWNFSPPM